MRWLIDHLKLNHCTERQELFVAEDSVSVAKTHTHTHEHSAANGGPRHCATRASTHLLGSH